MELDFERLREDLIEYYGTALMFEPLAVVDIIRVDTSDNSELIAIAQKEKFNIEDYIKGREYKRKI